MATYTVQAPDGKTITLEGPDGASHEDVIRQAQTLYSQPKESGAAGQPAPKPEKSTLERFGGSLATGLKTFRPALSQPDSPSLPKGSVGPPRDSESEALHRIKSDPVGYVKEHIPMLGTVERAFSQPLPEAAGTIIGESLAGMAGGAPGVASPKVVGAVSGGVKGGLAPVPLPHKWASSIPPVPASAAGAILGHFAGREIGAPTLGTVAGAIGPIVKGATEGAKGKPWLPQMATNEPRPSGARFEPSVSEVPPMEPVPATETPSGRKPGSMEHGARTEAAQRAFDLIAAEKARKSAYKAGIERFDPPNPAPPPPPRNQPEVSLPSGRTPGPVPQPAPMPPPPRPSGAKFGPTAPTEVPAMEPIKATATPSGRKPGGIQNQVDTPKPSPQEVAAAQGQSGLLDDIAKGMGAKSYAKLSPEGQATVRRLAEQVSGQKPPVPPPNVAAPKPPMPAPVAPPAPVQQPPMDAPPKPIGQPQPSAPNVPPVMERSPLVKGSRPSELGQHDSVNYHEINAVNKINNITHFLKNSDFLERNGILDLDKVTDADLRRMYDEAHAHGLRVGNPVPKTKYTTAFTDRDTWLKIKREMDPEKYDPAGLKDFLK